MAKESGNNNLLIIAAVVVGYLLYTGQIQLPKPSTPVVPVLVVPADLAAVAEPIKAIASRNPVVAKEAGKAYQDFKDVVLRDEKRIVTTEDLRRAIQAFEELLWVKTNAVGALPGFSAQASQVVSTAIGKEVVPLDAAKRVRAGQALDAISQALGA